MTIFELLLTNFEASVIFGRSWGSNENWFRPKTLPLYSSLTNISLSKSVKRSEGKTSCNPIDLFQGKKMSTSLIGIST